MEDKHHKEREHFFAAAKLVAIITLASRVLGMVRDMAITWLGANRTTDAFQVAFAIPNLFRRLFGEGALSAAFVPVFTETVETDGMEKAGKLLANAFCLLGAFLSCLAGLIVLVLIVWGTLLPGNWDRQLLLLLTGIMMPFMVTICLLALGSAALNCRGHFAYPAIAPIILNVFMIAGALLVAPRWPADRWAQLCAIAGSVTAAGIFQLAVMVWLLRRNGLSIRSKLFPVEGGVKRMLKIMGPMLLGFGLLQISSLFDYVIAWWWTATPESPVFTMLGLNLPCPLEPGVLVRYSAANRLYQFPMGVLAISLGVAIFPLFSRYAARGDIPNLRIAVNRAIRLSIMEGLATGTGMLVLAEPIIRLIFQHGKFTADDSAQSAFILKMYLLGMWAFCSYQIFLRAFYCMKDTTTPLKISCCLIVLYMTLVSLLVWVPSIKAGAFGIATATTASINVIVLAIMLRRKIGRIGARQLVASVSRSALACAMMAITLLQLRAELSGSAVELIAGWLTFHPLLGLPILPNSLVVAICVPVGAAVFIVSAWLMGAAELGELFGALRKGKSQETP
jgi:putative peptidoglycan lipid II flippase